jgi:hypothetical protein
VADHPGVPDHQVFDRRPLRVAEMERAGDVRWGLDDGERRQARIGRRAATVGREDIGRGPLLVDRTLDVPRRVGLRQVGHVLDAPRSLLK